MSSEWREVRLGEIATTLNGAGIKQEFFADEGIPLARVSNFSSGTIDLADCIFVDRHHAERWASHRINFGDVIVATVGSWPPNWSSVVGKVVRAPTSAVGALQNQNTCRVVARQGVTDQRFLYYLLSTQEFVLFAANAAAGSANQARLGVSSLEKFSFYLPSLDEQKEIGKFLGALDDRITLLRETNATLEAIAQALFKSWFVDFDPVRAKAESRQPEGMDPATAALFPDTFEDSELGPIPKGWNRLSFTDTVKVIGGGTPKTSVPEYWNGEIPWFSVVDSPSITDVFVIDTAKNISSSGLNKSSTKLLPEGTTIISARGTVGRLALTGTEMAMNQSCYGLQGKAGDSYFTYFSTYRLVESLKQRSHGSVFDTITTETMKGVSVIYPDDSVIHAFEAVLSSVMGRIRSNLMQAKTLTQLRDTLLPRLISGQLRLPEAERLVEEVC